MSDLVGWLSSVILVMTILVQVHRQWSEGSSEGVSVWLFIGQGVASLGFLTYSVMIASWVFVVTNATTALASVAGIAIMQLHRRREARGRSVSEELADPPINAPVCETRRAP